MTRVDSARARRAAACLAACLGAGLVGACEDEPGLVPGEDLPGGATTNTLVLGPGAFAEPFPTLDADERLDFFGGNHLFNVGWVEAPGSVAVLDGLGPTFHVDSCSGCHFHDGRSQLPIDGSPLRTALVRLSIPGVDAHGGPLAEPTYGGQLQPEGLPGVPGEATITVTFESVPGRYDDGTPFELRRPVLAIDALAFGPLHADVMTSLRVAPSTIGLGLLEAIPEATLRAWADPDDLDGDGISGRVNQVWDVRRGALAVGRFGWKAGQPTLEQQNAGAFHGDLGITTTLFPEANCPVPQTACAAAPSGGSPELDDAGLGLVTLYTRTLAVPMRTRARDAEVLRGRQAFEDAGCPSCHVPSVVTGAFPALPRLEGHRLFDYTDLLLHDLGDGLADGRPEFDAGPSEFRTPPLWGLSQQLAVSGHLTLLHDGRARGVDEAILWHGGEASAARDAFAAMRASTRAALVAFVESL